MAGAQPISSPRRVGSPRSPPRGAGGNGPEPITDLSAARGRGSDHRSSAPLSEETSPRHLKTPPRRDWPAGPPTAPPRAARPLLVEDGRQSQRSSPLTGRLPPHPTARAGPAASRRQGVLRPGGRPGTAASSHGGRAGERERGRARGRRESEGLTDTLPHWGAEGIPQQKVHRAAIS